MPYRVVIKERCQPPQFGEWKTADAANLEMIQIAHGWEQDGLTVKPWTDLFPRDLRERLVATLPKLNRNRWIYTVEIAPDD